MTLDQYLEQKQNETYKKMQNSRDAPDYSRGFWMGQYNLIVDLRNEIKKLSTTPALKLS